MMKPIRTPSDHKQALREIRRLMLQNSDGSHSDQIELLTALVQRYERETTPIVAPSPAAAIKFRMEQDQMTPRDLEPYIGSRARVSEVLSGKRSLSLDMMRALYEGLGIPLESLIGVGEAPPHRIEATRPVLNKLREWGYSIDPANISHFVESALGSTQGVALMRKTRTQRSSAKTDATALIIWQAVALTRAVAVRNLGHFDKSNFTDAKVRKLVQFSRAPRGPAAAIEFLASLGVATVINPILPGTFLDGAAMRSPAGTPVIALTLRHDRVDNFWFTLLHELAHILLHWKLLSGVESVFFDDLELPSEDSCESEADSFAQDHLVPTAALQVARWNKYSSNEDIEKIADAAGVHTSIVAGRWQRKHSDYRKFAKLIQRNTLKPLLGGDS